MDKTDYYTKMGILKTVYEIPLTFTKYYVYLIPFPW